MNSQHEISVSRISSLEEMASIAADWRSLEDEVDQSSLIFQSFDWCYTWAETFLGTCQHKKLCILVARANNRVIAIVPTMIDNISGLRCLCWLTQPYGQYGDILCAPQFQTPQTSDALLAGLKSQDDIDLVHLRHVREGGFASAFAQQHLSESGYYETAPFMDLAQYADEKSYQARYNKTQRRRRKKIANTIEQFGEISFTKHSKGETFDQLSELLLKFKQSWIAERGLHTSALRSSMMTAFIKALSQREGSYVETALTELKAGDLSISQELGLRYKGRHCAFITAHDPEHTNLSPGRLHMDHSQRLALADKITTFDLMVPGDAYKASWSSGVVKVSDYAMPLTWRGNIHYRIYIRFLRPIMRFIYLRSPDAIRHKAIVLSKLMQRK